MTNAHDASTAIDAPAFSPWVIGAVTHQWCGHPLLGIDALVELGQRLEARRLVRTHSDAAVAGSPFSDVPRLHPIKRSAAETLSGIADAHAWMSLLNVQADPVYQTLVDEVLDALKPMVDRYDPGMCFRSGWIFVSSSGAITPFHVGHEHNFILQIDGRKRLYVCGIRSTARGCPNRRRSCFTTATRARRSPGTTPSASEYGSSTSNPGRAATCHPSRRTWSRTAASRRSP